MVWGADGDAWLIDPAAHGGHRETDLAMLALFGCPHLHRVLAAYDEGAPLGDGWQARVPTHQLFPLLVHVVLFGRSYAALYVRVRLDGAVLPPGPVALADNTGKISVNAARPRARSCSTA